jgi:acetyl-CoA synthetase
MSSTIARRYLLVHRRHRLGHRHSYIVYGPLANGATTLMFEGVPNYPDASRFWQVVDKHQVNIFYTAPTAIRALMREGDAL